MSRAAGFRLWLLAFFLLLPIVQAPAQAAVEIAFYSRELGGNNFPHAFVALHGTVDSTGEQVNTSYGFTAHSVTPALLFDRVILRTSVGSRILLNTGLYRGDGNQLLREIVANIPTSPK